VKKFFACCSLLLLAACDNSLDSEKVSDGVPVRTASATAGPAAAPINSNGIVATRDEMRLSFKTGGIVRRILVEEGQTVRKGQLLAELDLTEVDAGAEQARQAADKAQRDLERGERLHADQVISLEMLQNLRTQAAVLRAARDAAVFNLQYSKIIAPRDGVVLRKLIEERELVPPGQPVLIQSGIERGYIVRLALADRDLLRVALDDRANIVLDAYPEQVFGGKVRQISAAADPRNGLFPVEVHFDPTPDQALASGLIAKVTITPANAGASTLTYIPIAALVEGEGGIARVFVVEGDVARKREVRVAFITGTEVALRDGLAVGTQLVTEGALYLVDGTRIRNVPPLAATERTP